MDVVDLSSGVDLCYVFSDFNHIIFVGLVEGESCLVLPLMSYEYTIVRTFEPAYLE